MYAVVEEQQISKTTWSANTTSDHGMDTGSEEQVNIVSTIQFKTFLWCYIFFLKNANVFAF